MLALPDKRRGGLGRVVDTVAQEHDDRRLTKPGGAIEDFNRQAFGLDLPTIEDPRRFVENLRAAPREMEAMSHGIPKPPDLSLDGAAASSDAARLPRK